MKQVVLIVFFLCFSYLKSATIQGKVTDAETGEELVGAYVYIKELGVGSSVGLDGTYLLKGVPVGTHSITVSYISYRSSVNVVSITDNDDQVKLNIILRSLNANMDEVEITASRDMGSEGSARSTERQVVNVMNVVSAKAIEISPDLNIANVIQRMSGITLDKSSGSGGQYALLRGMDKRYNYTLVNGIKIPSTNNKHRYVPLDIFPSDLVDRIEVTKSITANMEGDAIAGVVNLVMKNAPDNLLIQTNASMGYSGFFANEPLQTFDKSGIDLKSPYESHAQGYNATPSDFTKQNLIISKVNVPVNSIAGLTLGNRFFNKKLGVLFSGNYQNTKRGTSSILFGDDLSRDGNNLPILTDVNERIFYETSQNYGLHGKVDYRFNTRHQLKLYLANIHFTNKQIRSEDETSLTTSYDPENGFETRTHSDRLKYNIQNLFNTTLQGEHSLTSKFSVDWSAVYSKASNASPDEATIRYTTSLRNFQQVPGFVDFGGSTRRWRHNEDEDKAGYLNIKYTARFGKAKTIFTAGGLYRAKTRTSFYNNYTLIPYNTSQSKDSILYSAQGRDWKNYSEINWTVRNPRGSVGTSENFDANENVLAYYGMIKLDAGKMQAIGGLRFESTTQGYAMLFPAGEKRPEEDYLYTNVLPSVHLKYLMSPRTNLRGSYYKATNKPGFQEIVPFILIGDDYSSAGNPDLKQAISNNLDFRFEYFPNALDQFMTGFFYKDIKNPIEYAFVDYLGNSHEQVYSPINSDQALNYGIEIDFTKYKRQWGIKANYTWTSSHITTNKLSRIKTQRNQDSTIYISQTRPLFGQSAHVGNISLLYMSQKNGISAQLAFSYTGDRLYTVSRYIDNDLWQRGFLQLDFSCEKRFRHGLSVFAKAQNLLNTKVIVYIKKTNPDNAGKPYQSDGETNTLVRSEYSRSVYLAGIRYKFENKQSKIKTNN